MDDKQTIKRLQDNLQILRKLAGWTLKDLGERIGVEKQTIHNLENHKSDMKLTQYIATRSVFQYEIETNKNEVLAKAIEILVDNPEEIAESKYEDAQNNFAALAEAAIAGTALPILSGMLTSTVLPAIGLGVAGAIAPAIAPVAGALWLGKILKDKDKKKKGK